MKIGFWELVVIVIVAFVFIGPDQLPVYAKKIGKMLRELKKYTGAASEEIQKNVVEPLNEIQAPLKEAVAPLTDIKKDIDNSVKDVTKSFTGIGKTSKEEAAKAEAAEEVTELTEEPVEELKRTLHLPPRQRRALPLRKPLHLPKRPKNPPPRLKRLSLPLHPKRKRPSLQQKRLPHRKLPRLLLRPSRWRKTLVRMMFCRRTDYLLDAPAPAVA